MKKAGHTTRLPAKLSRPRINSRVLLRKRLFHALDEGLRRKALWVSGPAGSGKTTLVNSYIESKRLKTLWYQVDCADADPATFFHNLGAWAEHASRKKAPMPKYSPELGPDFATFSSRYFHELFSRVKPPFLIALDNFQEASGDAKFIEALCAGLKEAPPDCSFVFISRSGPPPAFARACVNKDMAVLSWSDLRLTEGESKEVAKLLGYKSWAKDLHSKAEGWVAGLLLLLERSKSGALPARGISGGAADMAFNYFMAEVFKKLDPATQGFLLKSSLFLDMTPEMAAGISGEREAARILSSLNAGNFFVAKRAHPSVSYQFHPLFRDFLLSRASEQFPPDYLKSLISSAALISEKAGQLDDAACLFIEACDWPGLKTFILSHAGALISQGRLKALEKMLESMPGDFAGRHPWLLYYHGVCRMPESPSGSRLMFEAAYDLFKSEDNPGGLFLSWTGVVESILYEWKDFKQLDRWIGEFERLRKIFPDFPSIETEVRATSCIFSAMMFRQPDHPGLPEWEGRIKGIFLASKDDSLRLSITKNLILYYLWTGNVDKAGVLVGSLKSAAKDKVNDPLAQIMWLRSAALYNLFSVSPETALAFVEEGLRLAETTGVHLLDTLFYGVGIYCCTFTEDVPRAGDFMGMIANGLNREKSLDLVFYYHQSSIVEWLKKDLPRAIEHSETALNLINESGVKINAGIYHFTLINQLIEAGRLDGIERRIAGLRDMAGLTGSRLYDYLAFFSVALLEFKKGRYDLSMESLGKGLKVCREHGIKVILVLIQPSSAATLCAMALERGIETEFIREIIPLNNLRRYPPHPGVEDWPWPIKIYALGRFEIYRDGKKMEFSRKAQQKPLALLKELVSAGGRQVPDEAITDALWPDSEGDLAYRSFVTTLHRLRKLLGNDRAIRYIDGAASLDRSCFWVDAWAFNHLIEKAESASGNAESSRLLERAARLFRGQYLPEESLPSAVSFRERLRGRFIRCVERLGALYEEAGNIEKALECYQRGLEADILAEGFYRRMMHCYKTAGKRTEALKTYTRLKTVLSDTFGIVPSAEIEALYQSIKDNN